MTLRRRRVVLGLLGNLMACRASDGRGGRRTASRPRPSDTSPELPAPAPAPAPPIPARPGGPATATSTAIDDDDDAVVDLWFAGDLHLGEGGPEVLADLRALAPAGLGFVNLEGPIGAPPEPGETNRRGGPVLINSPRAPQILRDLGVELVGVANNHAFDRCAVGESTTTHALRRAGLVAVGDSIEVVIERGGIRLAFTADDLDQALPASLPETLARARRRADHLIATFHVDGPPSYLPSPLLREAVEVALAAGASAVVAHGTHALARVESRGDAVIAWGLGNLAFACACTDEIDGAILGLRLGKRRVLGATWTPIAAGLGGAPVAAHPDPTLLFQLMRSLKSTPGIVDGGRLHLEIGPYRPA